MGGRLRLIIGLSVLLLIQQSEARTSEAYGKVFGRCTKEKNTFECLKRRALEILDDAVKDETVYVVNDFISIGRDARAARSLMEPRTLEVENATKPKTLDEELDRKFSEYLSSRSIKLTIPGDAFEGRSREFGFRGIFKLGFGGASE